MIPLYIDGCFAVLHPAAGRRAALICGTLSDEALNAYRSLVSLGEQLAAAGIPALRIAYLGTADSAGANDEPTSFDQWLDSIRAGVRWLRDSYGVTAVTLIGHRLGASLAARAASTCDGVDSLVLLHPASGRQILHELTLAARISQRVWGTDHKVDDGTWFEAHGLRIDLATRDALLALDIRKLSARPAKLALVLEPEQRQMAVEQVAALQQLGAEVTLAIHPELMQMQRDSYAAAVPLPAFETVLRWLQELPLVAGVGVLCREQLASNVALRLPQAWETPIQFGPEAGLFGILSSATRPARRAPAVLLVNTSANPRWGNARIAVDVARSLAAEGIASLRMDAAGMGDAASQTGTLGRPYAEATTQDVLHAVTELAHRTQRPVVIVGICSGAYHALHAAARDLRVCGLVLVNLQRFVWQDGDPSDSIRRTDLRPTAFYLRNILNPQAWYRLVRADFDVARLLRVVLLRLLRRGIAALDPLLGGTTRVGAVRNMVRSLTGRGTAVLYVLGCNDPGVEELAAYFGKNGWRLRRQPNVTIQLIAGADHTLGAAKVRTTLIRHIHAWFQDHWLSAAADVPQPRRQHYRPSVIIPPPSAPADHVAGG